MTLDDIEVALDIAQDGLAAGRELAWAVAQLELAGVLPTARCPSMLVKWSASGCGVRRDIGLHQSRSTAWPNPVMYSSCDSRPGYGTCSYSTSARSAWLGKSLSGTQSTHRTRSDSL
jgi:hypothetical protein